MKRIARSDYDEGGLEFLDDRIVISGISNLGHVGNRSCNLKIQSSSPDVKSAPRNKAAIIQLLALGAIFALLVNASATEWKTYRDDTAGYSITYPSFLRLARPLEGAQGMGIWQTKHFVSSDGSVELYVEFRQLAEGETLNSFFGDEVSKRTQGGDNVQYTFQKNNWFVITGTNAKGFDYYTKAYFFNDSTGRWYISWDFVYPHTQHKLYDPLVTPIAKRFVPNLPGQHWHD